MNSILRRSLASQGLPSGTVFNFDCTGTVQEIELPKGSYKLQCWGAQGGNSYTGGAVGSKGGYSEGVLNLSSPTTLYAFVGGKGANGNGSTSVVNGGWNGGGGSVGYCSYGSTNNTSGLGISYPACGGGSTDFCSTTSDMTYNNYRTSRSSTSLLSRCIVAGGGAGGSYYKWSYSVSNTTYNKTNIIDLSDWQGTIHEANVSVNSVHNPSQNKYMYVTAGNFIDGGNDLYGDEVYDYWFPKLIIIFSGIGDAIFFNVSARSTTRIDLSNYVGRTILSIGSNVYINNNLDDYVYVDLDVFTVDCMEAITTTTSDSSSGVSSTSQQGGGTSGKGQYPGTQSSAGSGGAFGLGASQSTTNYRYASGAGGGGWYGGGKSVSDSSTSYVNYSGGGSGFVNTAANAQYRPSGYTGLELESGETIDGSQTFEAPGGGTETGHAGNGYARITVL